MVATEVMIIMIANDREDNGSMNDNSDVNGENGGVDDNDHDGVMIVSKPE